MQLKSLYEAENVSNRLFNNEKHRKWAKIRAYLGNGLILNSYSEIFEKVLSLIRFRKPWEFGDEVCQQAITSGIFKIFSTR